MHFTILFIPVALGHRDILTNQLLPLRANDKHEHLCRLSVVDGHIPFFARSNVNHIPLVKYVGFTVFTVNRDGAFCDVINTLLGRGAHFRPPVWLKIGITDRNPLGISFDKLLQPVYAEMLGSVVLGSLGIFDTDHPMPPLR